MTSTSQLEHAEMFSAVVRRLQREASHLSSQWLEPWLAIQAASEVVRGEGDGPKNNNRVVASPSSSSSSAAKASSQPHHVDHDGDDEANSSLTPQRAALAIIHHIATLKAAAMGAPQPTSSSTSTAADDDARRLFQQTVSSTKEFEFRIEHLVPLPFTPISLLLLNALDDLEAREQAMRGLLELCDTTYIPELHKGKESAAMRQQVALYKKLKIELKRVFFTLSVEIIPWLREFVGWYDLPGRRGPTVAKPKVSPSSKGSNNNNNNNSANKTYSSLTSTDVEDDDEQQRGGFGRALSLVEIPIDEDALEEYERQRREELRQVGQQVRELRELQEYANTLVTEHGTKLEHSVEQADAALDNATSSRMQLTLAAKYKIAGAALTGALVGGLLGGPIGLIAGAKSATTIGLVALAGGATGSVVGSTVASTTASRSAAVDENYENQREHQQHVHSQ